MLHRLLIAFLALATAATSASAANIYKPGTLGDEVYRMAEPFLPSNMTAVVLLNSEPAATLMDVDPAKAKAAEIPADTFRAFLNDIAAYQPVPPETRAYSLTGKQIPGNVKVVRYCAIVVVNRDLPFIDQAISHEALHCRNSQIRDTAQFDELIKAGWEAQLPKMPIEEYAKYIDEVLVSALQVSIEKRQGAKEIPFFLEAFSEPDNHPGKSIGDRTAKILLERCWNETGCPTDSVGMLKFLVSTPSIMNAVSADIPEIRNP